MMRLGAVSVWQNDRRWQGRFERVELDLAWQGEGKGRGGRDLVVLIAQAG